LYNWSRDDVLTISKFILEKVESFFLIFLPMRTKLFKIESPHQFFFFRKTTTKNCLKTVWGFKMSFFEENIEFNFEGLDN